jgi:hypothetical protein
MTTTRRPGGAAAVARAEAKLVAQALAAEPLVRDHRDLPAPLDVLGARFRAGKIRFAVRASQHGYGLELRLPKSAAMRERVLARAWAIWQGTIGGTE